MGKKKSDALYNRMRNGKEDLEKYYKERERFCNKTTCSGHDIADHEEMNADINRINKETLDRINKEQSRASLRMVTHFEGSSILPEDKRKFDEKWNAKLLEFGKRMEEKGLAFMKERDAKAQRLKEVQVHPSAEDEGAKAERQEYSDEDLKDIKDGIGAELHERLRKSRVAISKWKRLQVITRWFIRFQSTWLILQLVISLFVEGGLENKSIVIGLIMFGLVGGLITKWAIERKMDHMAEKAHKNDLEWFKSVSLNSKDEK